MKKQCCRCHKEVDPDALKFIRGKEIAVCGECADEKYEVCESCHEYFVPQDLVFAGHNDRICLWCLSEKYVLCPHCKDFIPNEETIKFHGHALCAGCRKDYFEKCSICKTRIESDELEVIWQGGRSVSVCPSCLRTQYVRCANCEQYIARSSAVKHEDRFFCPDCFLYNFEKCGDCGKMTSCDDIEYVTVGGRTLELCPVCRKQYADCAGCCNTFPKKQLVLLNGEQYCKSCLQSVMAAMAESERRRAVISLGAAAAGILAGKKLADWMSGSAVSYNPAAPSGTGVADYESMISDIEDEIGDDYCGDGLDGFDSGAGE